MPLEGCMTTVHEAQPPGLSEENSVRQDSFTELTEIKEEAEVELENEDELVADHRDKSACSSPDLSRSDDTGDEVKVAEALPDVRTDHPTSTQEVQCDNGDRRNNNCPAVCRRTGKDIAVGAAGPGSVEPDEDYGASDVDTTGPRRSVDLEKSDDETGRTQTASADGEFRNVSNEALDADEWSSERQRPTRAARRLTRLKYREFGTHVRSEERRKCNKLGRGDQARNDISNVSNFNKYVKKANVRFRFGRGVKQKLTQEVNLPTGSQPTSPNQRGYTTQKLSLRADRHVEKQLIKRKRRLISEYQGLRRTTSKKFWGQNKTVVKHRKFNWHPNQLQIASERMRRYERRIGNDTRL